MVKVQKQQELLNKIKFEKQQIKSKLVKDDSKKRQLLELKLQQEFLEHSSCVKIQAFFRMVLAKKKYQASLMKQKNDVLYEKFKLQNVLKAMESAINSVQSAQKQIQLKQIILKRIKRNAFDRMKCKQEDKLMTKVRTLSSNEEYISIENDQFYDSPQGSPIGELHKSPDPKKGGKMVHLKLDKEVKDMTKSQNYGVSNAI